MAERFAIPGVDGATPIASAAPAILLAKAGRLLDLESAAHDRTDPELVHDMRVASRRLREALRLLAPAYRGRDLHEWRQRVRAITRALGPVRDADVFVDALASLRDGLSVDGQRAAAFLAGYTLGQRSRDLARLSDSLPEMGLSRHRERFEATVVHVRSGAAPGRPLSSLAREAVGARVRDVSEAQSRAVSAGGMTEHHDLRIAYKRLRYAVEVFAPCYGDRLGSALDALRAFQDVLGDLHDTHVFAGIVDERSHDGSAQQAGVRRTDLEAVLAAIGSREADAEQRFDALLRVHPARALERTLLAPFGPEGEPTCG